MSSWLRHFVTAVVAAVLIWLGTPTASSLPIVPTPLHTYGYDASLKGGQVVETAMERGPPAISYNHNITHPAVGSASHRISERASGPLAPETYDYDPDTRLAQVDHGGDTTTKTPRAISVDPSSLQHGEAAAKTACFVAGTPILLADGTSKPIEEIEVGDRVIATNPETGEEESRTVARTYIHHDIPTWDVVVDGETVTTTAEHPFWVDGQRWTPVDQLKPGDQLTQPDGTTVAVDHVRPTGQTADVYNFEVEGLHDYYVQAGDHWILVHNTCGPLTGGQSRQALDYLGVDTRRVVGRIKGREPVYQLPDGRVITRDLDGHVPSGTWKVARRVEDLRLKRTREGTFGLDADGNLVQVGP